jgi:lysozyme family protein
MTRSEKFICKIIIAEGGSKVTNDATDAGGLTKYGISQRTFPNLDIKNLTEQQAIDIYTINYCNTCKVDSFIDELLALHLFDFAVNSGVVHSVQTLQRILNIADDGRIGPITITTANLNKDAVVKFIQARIDFYCQIAAKSLQKYEAKIGRSATYDEKMNHTNYKYLKGWCNRVNNLKV